MNAAEIQFISFRTTVGNILLVNARAVEYIYTSKDEWSLHLRNGERIAIKPSKTLLDIKELSEKNYRGEEE